MRITDPPTGIPGRAIGEAAGIVLTAPASLTTDNFTSSFRIKHRAFDPDDGQIQVVSAKLQESASWTVEAKKFIDQSVVWSTSGESDWIHVTWDGLDQNQQLIESGRYSIVLTIDEPEPLEPGIQSQSSVQHILKKEMSKLGSHRFGFMWQGHHPSSAGGNYTSSRPRTYPGFIGSPIDFTAFSGNGPWGRLGSPESITLAASIDFMFSAGYREHFSLENDLVTAAHLRKASAGGTNRFNDVDIGLYIGHASSGKQAETATGLFVPQAYIPIYNSTANSWDWVRTMDSEFGSERLKWMHLLVCNYFRASPHRSDSIFDGLRNSGALPINTDLHVLSSMASEVWLSVRLANYG